MRNKKLKEFIKTKSFFVVLAVGVCSVTILSYTVSAIKNNKNNLKRAKIVKNDQIKELDKKISKKQKQLKKNNKKDINKGQENLIASKKISEVTSKKTNSNAERVNRENNRERNTIEVVSVSDKNLKFNEESGIAWPIKGDVIMKYSMDKLVYHKTLGQYKCNPAILIKASDGKNVANAYKGIVTKVYKDNKTGTTVEVNIGNNYKLIYGQLKNVKVKENDMLKEGDIIGNITTPTAYYAKEGEHLYFEVKQDKKSVDPMILLR